MKKCPVCGVEHSDIVPVCSICGSPLSAPEAESAPAPQEVPKAAETLKSESKAELKAEVKPEAKAEPEAPKTGDFTEDDIFKAVSSLVASSMPEEPAGEKIGNLVLKPKKGEKQAEKVTEPAPEAEGAPSPFSQDALDTTAVAAASAAKLQEALQNAEAARARTAEVADTYEAPEEEPSWSERKHKRGQKSTTTPVIAAVCAVLALLIVAMLFLLGKMMLDEPADKPDGDDQPGNSQGDQLPGDEQEDPQLPGASEDETQDPDAQDPDAEGEGTDILPQEGEGDEEANEGDEGENEPLRPEGDEPPQNNGGQANRPALPEVTETDDKVETTAAVNVRDYPSTDHGAILNTLRSGQVLQRTGKANGWSRVKVGDQEGWVSDTYLKAAASDQEDGNDGAQADGDARYVSAAGGVNLRETPDGTVLGTLGHGQKVTLTGKTSGNWTQVKVNGLTGYVYSSYLSKTAVNGTGSEDGEDTPAQRPAVNVTKVNETVYALAGVNVRDYPSSSQGDVLTVLSKGQQVKRNGKTANGWSRIEVGNIEGYVYSDYLSTSKNNADTDDGDEGDDGAYITGYILPKVASKKYTADELSELSASQLRLARNEIFARHGRKFNDQSLQDYFDSCTWYEGTISPSAFDANIKDYLNSYELANLDLIKSLE